MEMMIVLLIVAIIASASAPMVSKKLMRDTAAGNSPWVYAGLNGSITYNPDGNENKVAMIGTVDSSKADSAKLLIKSSNNEPQIALSASGKDESMKIRAKNSSIIISNNTLPSNVLSSVGIGSGITFTGGFGTADGYDVNAASHAVAIGHTAVANQLNGIAIGRNTTAKSAIAIGDNTKSLASAVAIGKSANSNGANAVAIGTNTTAARTSIVIGRQATASGDNSTAIGAYADASGNYSIALGRKTYAGDSSVAQGYMAKATSYSIAQGYLASATSNSVAIGNNTKAMGISSTAIGYSASANGAYATAFGMSANASAQGATALGDETKASGKYSTAVGEGAEAPANYSAALGGIAMSKATYSLALGYNSTASYSRSVALGADTKTTSMNQIVLGTKNDTVVIPGKLEVNGDGGQMTLGGPNTTIYIPGKLVVDYDVELAKKSGEIRGRFFGYGRSEYGRMWFTIDNLLMMKPSDRRLKNVGEAFTSGLDKIKQLKVYNFTFKNDTNKTPQVGVIAQDLQKVFPNAVTKGEDGFLRIRWDEIFYALVNAVKELDTKVEALIKREQKINELEKQVASLKSDMKKLEKRLA